jgi:hypothetical protein
MRDMTGIDGLLLARGPRLPKRLEEHTQLRLD